MDRGTKLMFAMMTAAVCLMVIMMISREAPRAHAEMYRGDAGGEPTIVSFRVTPLAGFDYIYYGNGSPAATTSAFLLTRMWSDGSVEVNVVGSETVGNSGDLDGGAGPQWKTRLMSDDVFFTGWKLVTDSVAGYRCAGDTDGNRDVDIEDLLSVINDYGACEQAPPADLPPDSDQ